MAKSLAASKTLMQNYLSELLTEEQHESEVPVAPVKEKNEQPLEKLLQKVDITQNIAVPKEEPIQTVRSSVNQQKPKVKVIKPPANEIVKKEILIDDIDNKVVKRFKRIERFIDYKFKNKEIINDFLIFYDIKIIYLSKALHLKKNLIQKYNFNNYNNSQDINKPILFYGVYRDYDIEIIKNHKGLKYIYWDDNDANINYENRRANLLELSNLATMNLCGTMIVEKYLQIMNIDYKKIEF